MKVGGVGSGSSLRIFSLYLFFRLKCECLLISHLLP